MSPELGGIGRRYLILLLALAGLASTAGARTYCCNDDNGRRLCGDILPPQCAKRAYQEYNSMGVVSLQHEAPLTAEQRAQRDAELARKKAAARIAAERDRVNRALLASYSSVGDIDAKRERVLSEANNALQALRQRQEAAQAEQQRLAAEAEFFTKRPMPDNLRMSIRDNKLEVANLQTTVDDKIKEIAAIQARFDEERQRYLSLVGSNKAAQGSR